VPSLNPLPFYNDGVIDFQDGATDDMLTITGDFAGNGDINVDASGLDGSCDILYSRWQRGLGTHGVINVDLLDLPETIADAAPGGLRDRRLGRVQLRAGRRELGRGQRFVTLDFDLIADIDATNATPTCSRWASK
jgi:hypothetical protein